MPRLVFERVQRAVASTARRTVAPSGRVAGAGQRLANRRRAGEEVFVAGVGEVAARRDVARLRRARLEETGELRRGRDVCRSERTARRRRRTDAHHAGGPRLA